MEVIDVDELFAFSSSVKESPEWKDLELKEYSVGADALLEEITEKRIWSNAELMWVIKRLIYFYGSNDSLLKKAPKERLFLNLVDVLRAFYLIIDELDPKIDDNMRSYICSKLADATWGVNPRTRSYLNKLE
jgi:hypothetical protein